MTDPRKPLCIELFCGMFGWSSGWLEFGGRAIGFDIEHLPHHRPVPEGASLVLQDVLTLYGSQFRDAALILASPPCQAYSYRAMPWKRAKALPPPSNELFDACFRIQQEASEAAGRHIPMVVENVCGAQKWVGRAKWHFGSFYLWGDVPALMPPVLRGTKNNGVKQHGSGAARFDKALDERRKEATAIKNGKDWFGSGENCSLQRRQSSRSDSRKAASAQIAKIPFELSLYIAQVYWPEEIPA